jgi:2-haloacid dehalogenase
MERYEDFWGDHERGVAFIRQSTKNRSERSSARSPPTGLQGYLYAGAFPDARPALESLAGASLVILSNGSPKILDSVVRNSGLKHYFTEIISVEQVKTYQPSPQVYALGSDVLNLPAEEILYVSSNSWDAAGAKAFGYQVCWCNRDNMEGERLGFPADITVPRLDQISCYI